MTNELRQLAKDLKAFAKRCKEFKYTESALFAFPLLGLTSFAETSTTDKAIQNQRQEISTSIGDMRQQFRKIKTENDKLMKDYNLELIQLMEQGDHVVKSPWSSWQYGANTILNDWHGSYKGRGDKKEKYPYEGILERSSDPYERNVSTDSKNYSLLSKTTNVKSASSNNRQGMKGYGIASTKPVKEPIVGFEVNAGINPRKFVAPTVTPLNATQPNLPKAINFKPVKPQITPPDTPYIPTISAWAPGTGNGEQAYIVDASNGTSGTLLSGGSNGTDGNTDVAPISHQSINGGKMTVSTTGRSSNITTDGMTFTGVSNSSANGNGLTYSTNLGLTNNTAYAVMKNVGGSTLKINNATIDFSGDGLWTRGSNQTSKWLFHTDGHNNYGSSTWVLGSGTNINLLGKNLMMYTSQYHGYSHDHSTIGFVNDGATITSTGDSNKVWVGLSESAYNDNRFMYFYNKAGSINLGGKENVFSYIDIPLTGNGGAQYGFTIKNDADINLTGDKDFGIIVASGREYSNSEILLNKPISVKGSNSVGILFNGSWADLNGGSSRVKSSANNEVTDFYPSAAAGATVQTNPSIIKLDLAGNNNTGIYFNYSGANSFDIDDYNITSTNGTKNIGLYIVDGKVNLGSTGTHAITMTGGSGNTGIYTSASDPLTTAATINITNSDSSMGIYAAGGTTTSTGDITVSGGSVKGLVAASGATITNSGALNVTGTALTPTDGSAGLASLGGTITQTGNTNISVDGAASTGAYAENGGTLNVGAGLIKTTNGAFNVFSNNGTINLNSTGIDTGQKSLAFFATNNGHINFTGPTIANIAGGTDADTRGTAFYYQGSGYSPFGVSNISSWAGSTFGGTAGQLTLNMASGSRLFIASDVSMNLSDTVGTGLAGAIGANINGTDYKTFMLYLSKLTLNNSIDLDNPLDAYNQLEISNSSIDNDNNNNITGTQNGQTAIAQENLTTNRAAVTLNNNGNINLSGTNSTGMYAKYGVINNNSTGTITIGDSSTGLYGTEDSILTNTGTITMGNSSTGMYSEGSTTQGITNAGTITSAGTASVGVLYKPASTIPTGTVLGNTGTITLGDSSVGLYGMNTATNYTTSNSGDITVGNKGIGMFGYASDVSGGTITVGDTGVGVYSQGGNVNLTGGTITTGASEAVGVYTVGSGQTITNSGTAFNLGDTSVAIANAGTGNTINSTVGNVGLGTNNIYIYSSDTGGTVNNSTTLNAAGGGNYGIYSAGNVINTGDMNFGNGTGNVGIYSIGGGNATNNGGVITIGGSNPTANSYSIGMAAGYGTTDTGHVTNNGTINVNGDYGIGMYASGAGSTATNASNIVLNGNNTTGIYADNGATAINTGSISTGSGSYSNVVGVYLGQGSTLNNTGSITIDGSNAVGVYLKGGTIANYGNITVNGSSNPDDTVYTFTTPATGKGVGGALINAPAGATSATITINGVPQTPVTVNTFAKNPINVSASSIGLYVNTSGVDYTNSINGLGNLTSEADLIIGTEATEMTNSKSILVNDPKILNPYNNAMRSSGVSNWNIYSAGLNWLATPTLNPTDGTMTNIYMVKVPYTAWAGKENTPVNSTDTYNFLDGLEQRYGVDWYGDRGARERQLFSKLNSIGNNEEALFYQATDEMMGHQYGNVQQRINETGSLLDKEFKYLRNDWRNPSKQNNKIKVFGMRNEYNTDTAGIIDYTSNAYGVAYVHEDETVKLGNSSGWYAGAVNNRFKFKDIGGSRENQTMVKAGIFKTMSPYMDHNGSLRWTIAGDVFAGRNEMKRRFLVVDDVFGAKGSYTSYGAAFKTDLGYDIRMSERTHLRPYGALKMEYGRFNNIKEDDGEVRLEVKGNDYFSVKPEVGMEFKYVQPMAVRTQLSVGLTAAYENELGRVADGKNVARVRFTDADWFGIRGEKEDRRGSGKFDLNIGVDNTRFGVTANLGYDTKGSNIRGGIGFRAIY